MSNPINNSKTLEWTNQRFKSRFSRVNRHCIPSCEAAPRRPMKKALEIRPVLAPGPYISDAVFQIRFGMPRKKENCSNIIHTSLSTRQMPQDATCRDSCGTFASIAGLSNMHNLKNQQTKIGAGNGRERLAMW